MELVTHSELKECALTKVLKTFHSLLEKSGVGEKFRSVPASFYLIDKWAQKGSTPVHSVLLDICPTRDHYVYKHGSAETACPKCKVPRTNARQMMVGDVVTLLKMMFKVPQLAEVELFYLYH